MLGAYKTKVGGKPGDGGLDQYPLFPGLTPTGPFCSASLYLNIPHLRAWTLVSFDDDVLLRRLSPGLAGWASD